MCPRCGSMMAYVSEGFFQCVNCGYRKSAVERIPSQDKLWKEVKSLRELKEVAREVAMGEKPASDLLEFFELPPPFYEDKKCYD